ncbi:RDD domain containing protein [Nonlabens dokdonensis DSW-6]|uniref:RDD domain containing protein n=2 Tax=Nonlabens dokdonensis TaxID=328515 RepID=L7W5M1_NONDD|nr:RDD domain containing protein [Nonlabens dokdonensis DSW-6]
MTSEVLGNFENVPTYLRFILFVSYFFLYEPVSIAFFKGTIGQQFINIRVENEKGNAVNFFAAVLRMIIKYSLGWISLLTVHGDSRKQAIHDNLVNSLVLRN